jgi:hypothetical protein
MIDGYAHNILLFLYCILLAGFCAFFTVAAPAAGPRNSVGQPKWHFSSCRNSVNSLNPLMSISEHRSDVDMSAYADDDLLPFSNKL